MVLDPVQQREKVSLAMGAINEVSIYAQNSQKEFEKTINKFLDHINDTKQLLTKRAVEVSAIVPKIAELTWLAQVDNEVLSDIKELVDGVLTLNKVMVTFWVMVNRNFDKHKIAKTELKHYKQAADDLKELASDLKDRFFALPEDKEFQELMQQLADL